MRASYFALVVLALVCLLSEVNAGHHHDCNDGEFRCTEDECIPADWRCDDHPDCNNGNDEMDCSFTCDSSHFQCGSQQCIPEGWMCDGDNDCDDASDETRTACPGRNTH